MSPKTTITETFPVPCPSWPVLLDGENSKSRRLHAVGTQEPSFIPPRFLSSIAMADSVLPGIPGYNPHNLQPWTVEVVVSVTVLATVTVLLRLLSRHIKAQKLWWDDYMIIFSLVCSPRTLASRLSPS